MWPRPSRDPVSLPSSAGIRARPKPLWPPWRVAGGGWHPAQGQPLRPAARSRDGGRVLRLQGRLQLHSCLLPAVWGPGLGTGRVGTGSEALAPRATQRAGLGAGSPPHPELPLRVHPKGARPQPSGGPRCGKEEPGPQA